uniref:Putative secreted peptide n=1 Tax=Anopheles braziliensis TaxID=58242 RepID=A0A2M3ZXP3_9DIPT
MTDHLLLTCCSVCVRGHVCARELNLSCSNPGARCRHVVRCPSKVHITLPNPHTPRDTPLSSGGCGCVT